MAEGSKEGQPTSKDASTQAGEGATSETTATTTASGTGNATTAAGTVPIDTTTTWQHSGRKGNFSQDDLNRVAGHARQEARDLALSDLAKELGVPGIDDVKEAMQAHKDAQDARLDELGKLQKTHDTVTKQRDTLRSQVEVLNERLVNVQRAQALQVSLIEAGVNPERVSTVSRLVDHDSLEVDESGNVSGVKEAVASAKEQAPELFATATRSVGASGGNPPIDPPEAKDDIWSMPSEQFAAYRKRALQGEKITFS